MNELNHPNDPSTNGIPRRQLLRTGVLGLGAVALSSSALGAAAQRTSPDEKFEWDSEMFASTCTLTPNAVQGPFWQNLNLVRQDITEGLLGYPVSLVLQVLDAATCAPMVGAVVDVWHDGADGRYSGFASEGTLGQTQHRGVQITGNNGVVRFETIYPGWYPGRTPHFHVKVNPTQTTELTTQLYMDDDISTRLYTFVPPYDTRGPSPVTNATDGFYIPELEASVRPLSNPGRLLISKRLVVQ